MIEAVTVFLEEIQKIFPSYKIYRNWPSVDENPETPYMVFFEGRWSVQHGQSQFVKKLSDGRQIFSGAIWTGNSADLNFICRNTEEGYAFMQNISRFFSVDFNSLSDSSVSRDMSFIVGAGDPQAFQATFNVRLQGLNPVQDPSDAQDGTRRYLASFGFDSPDFILSRLPTLKKTELDVTVSETAGA